LATQTKFREIEKSKKNIREIENSNVFIEPEEQQQDS